MATNKTYFNDLLPSKTIHKVNCPNCRASVEFITTYYPHTNHRNILLDNCLLCDSKLESHNIKFIGYK